MVVPYQMLRNCFALKKTDWEVVLNDTHSLKNFCYRQAEWCGDSISHPEGQREKEKAAAHDTDKRSEETDA